MSAFTRCATPGCPFRVRLADRRRVVRNHGRTYRARDGRSCYRCRRGWTKHLRPCNAVHPNGQDRCGLPAEHGGLFHDAARGEVSCAPWEAEAVALDPTQRPGAP